VIAWTWQGELTVALFALLWSGLIGLAIYAAKMMGRLTALEEWKRIYERGNGLPDKKNG
jgi:hypothetical protein